MQEIDFLEFQRDEAPKVLGGELGSSDFGRFAKEQNLDPVLAGSRFMSLQKAEADLAESNRIDPKDAIDLKNKEETTRQLFDKPLNPTPAAGVRRGGIRLRVSVNIRAHSEYVYVPALSVDSIPPTFPLGISFKTVLYVRAVI